MKVNKSIKELQIKALENFVKRKHLEHILSGNGDKPLVIYSNFITIHKKENYAKN